MNSANINIKEALDSNLDEKTPDIEELLNSKAEENSSKDKYEINDNEKNNTYFKEKSLNTDSRFIQPFNLSFKKKNKTLRTKHTAVIMGAKDSYYRDKEYEFDELMQIFMKKKDYINENNDQFEENEIQEDNENYDEKSQKENNEEIEKTENKDAKKANNKKGVIKTTKIKDKGIQEKEEQNTSPVKEFKIKKEKNSDSEDANNKNENENNETENQEEEDEEDEEEEEENEEEEKNKIDENENNEEENKNSENEEENNNIRKKEEDKNNENEDENKEKENEGNNEDEKNEKSKELEEIKENEDDYEKENDEYEKYLKNNLFKNLELNENFECKENILIMDYITKIHIIFEFIEKLVKYTKNIIDTNEINEPTEYIILNELLYILNINKIPENKEKKKKIEELIQKLKFELYQFTVVDFNELMKKLDYNNENAKYQLILNKINEITNLYSPDIKFNVEIAEKNMNFIEYYKNKINNTNTKIKNNEEKEITKKLLQLEINKNNFINLSKGFNNLKINIYNLLLTMLKNYNNYNVNDNEVNKKLKECIKNEFREINKYYLNYKIINPQSVINDISKDKNEENSIKENTTEKNILIDNLIDNIDMDIDENNNNQIDIINKNNIIYPNKNKKLKEANSLINDTINNNATELEKSNNNKNKNNSHKNNKKDIKKDNSQINKSIDNKKAERTKSNNKKFENNNNKNINYHNIPEKNKNIIKSSIFSKNLNNNKEKTEEENNNLLISSKYIDIEETTIDLFNEKNPNDKLSLDKTDKLYNKIKKEDKIKFEKIVENLGTVMNEWDYQYMKNGEFDWLLSVIFTKHTSKKLKELLKKSTDYNKNFNEYKEFMKIFEKNNSNNEENIIIKSKFDVFKLFLYKKKFLDKINTLKNPNKNINYNIENEDKKNKKYKKISCLYSPKYTFVDKELNLNELKAKDKKNADKYDIISKDNDSDENNSNISEEINIDNDKIEFPNKDENCSDFYDNSIKYNNNKKKKMKILIKKKNIENEDKQIKNTEENNNDISEEINIDNDKIEIPNKDENFSDFDNDSMKYNNNKKKKKKILIKNKNLKNNIDEIKDMKIEENDIIKNFEYKKNISNNKIIDIYENNTINQEENEYIEENIIEKQNTKKLKNNIENEEYELFNENDNDNYLNYSENSISQPEKDNKIQSFRKIKNKMNEEFSNEENNSKIITIKTKIMKEFGKNKTTFNKNDTKDNNKNKVNNKFTKMNNNYNYVIKPNNINKNSNMELENSDDEDNFDINNTTAIENEIAIAQNKLFKALLKDQYSKMNFTLYNYKWKEFYERNRNNLQLKEKLLKNVYNNPNPNNK